MNQPTRKHIRLSNYDYSSSGAYFITICAKDKQHLFSEITMTETGVPQPILTELGTIAEDQLLKLNERYPHVSVASYVIMPDHIHLLITIHDGHPERCVTTRTSEIARFVGTFKRFCNKEYGSNIWQSRYYDHVIRNQQDYNEVWEYIENNPTKWAINKKIL